MILHTQTMENVRLITFNHPKPTNPFSDALQDAVMAALDHADSDDSVQAIVLYGGKDRSFSAGGDFGEVVDMCDYDIVAELLGKVVDFYIHILNTQKPVIAAIDNYAIGMGFQVALCTDARIASDRTKFKMPELKNGVACTLGGYMLDYCIGRFHTQTICYDCHTLDLSYCKSLGIVTDIVPEDQLLAAAIAKAQDYASYPTLAFQRTRASNNRRFIEVLEKARKATIEDHAAVFTSKQHQNYMHSILKK